MLLTIFRIRNCYGIKPPGRELKWKFLQPGKHEDDDEKDGQDYQGFHSLPFSKSIKIDSY